MRNLLLPLDRVLRSPSETPGVSPLGAGHLIGILVACAAFYGAIMGAYGGFAGDRALQVVYSAIKVPLLLIVTFTITLPSFFILNTILGLRSDFRQALHALLVAQAGFAVTLAALAPYTVLWYISFRNYHGASLFNGFLFAVASGAAQSLLRRHYAPLIRRQAKHRRLLLAWLVIYIFVGVQMTWVLRPFLGWEDIPVTFFRQEKWVNAYVELFKTFYWYLTQ